MTNRHEQLPAELHDIAAAVDRLAAVDAAAPPGLEDRVFEATRGVFADPVVARIVPRRVWSPVRMAAAVAIVSAGAALWLANIGGPGATTVPGLSAEAYADHLVVLASLDDDWSSLNERLDVLRLETEAVAGSYSWDWASPLTSEGAM